MEEAIDLKDYFKTISKNFKTVISITLIFGLVGFGISFLVKPKTTIEEDREFESEARIVVEDYTQGLSDYIDSSIDKKDIRDEVNKAINNSNILAKNNSMLIFSSNILNQVIENLNLDTTVQELRKDYNINIWPIDNTNVIKVYTKSYDKELTDDIVNEIVNVFIEQNPEFKVSIIEKAVEPILPIPILDANGKPIPEKDLENEKPRVSIKKLIINTIIGVVFGGITSLFVIFIKEYMDNKLRTEKQVNELLGIEVIGVIPKEGDK